MGGAGMAGSATAGMGGMDAAGSGGTDAAGSGGAGGGDLALTSTAVMNDGMLPAMYRCVSLFGDPGPSPPLAWTAGPAGTMSYTLVFKDTSPAGTLGAGTIHWVIKNIPMATMMLPMEVATGAMPGNVSGATQVANGLGDEGYRGPCGGMNDYTFTLYAVNKAAIDATTGAAVETEAMANNVGTATLVIHSMP
jgi:Raf kinase inhibitor-like YbhB/YbcL family protein